MIWELPHSKERANPLRKKNMGLTRIPHTTGPRFGIFGPEAYHLLYSGNLYIDNHLLIPHLHRGCDLCASLVRPQNWPGRSWSTLEVERLPWSFKGGIEGVQTSLRTPWSPESFEHVQNSHTNVAEEVGRSQVAQRGQEEGTHIATVAEWMYRSRQMVAP